jgi:hypothetical protein
MSVILKYKILSLLSRKPDSGILKADPISDPVFSPIHKKPIFDPMSDFKSNSPTIEQITVCKTPKLILNIITKKKIQKNLQNYKKIHFFTILQQKLKAVRCK